LKNYKAYIFDLDGVIWLGQYPIPGVAEAVNGLKANGAQIRFLSNNACEHRDYQHNKLAAQGIKAELGEVFTAGSATALYLKQKFGPSKVHVLGTSDLEREMSDAGHTVVERNAQVVVTGLDKEFNWEKLDTALQNISIDGARYIVCNADPNYPEKGLVRPGGGAPAAALTCCTGREPEIVVGKPNPEIFRLVHSSLDCPVEECLMVGDKIQTDIIGAKQIGMDTALVLSGIGTEKDIEETGVEPTYVLESVAGLKR
jgi:HAD superfamily hydrolase (TIGR01450 family)